MRYLRTRWLATLAAICIAVTTLSIVTTRHRADAFIDVGVSVFQTSSDHDSLKTATVSCPSDLRLYSGGAQVSPSTGKVVLTKMVPKRENGIDKFVTQAHATEAYPETVEWRLTAYAVCGPFISGLEIMPPVTDTAPTGSRDRVAVADCPTSKVTIGLGGEIVGGMNRVSFRMLNPVTDIDASRAAVAAREDQLDGLAVPPNFHVRAYVICSNERPFQVQTSGDETVGKNSPISAQITCPGANNAFAPGVIITDRWGNAYLTGIVPSTTDHRKVTVFAARGAPSGPDIPDWTLDTSVVCTS